MSRVRAACDAIGAMAVIGVVATVAGLSVFSASGQTGDDEAGFGRH